MNTDNAWHNVDHKVTTPLPKMAILVVITATFFAAASGTARGKPYHNLQIKDMSGRQVTIHHTPGRIVCLGPGSLRLIVYLQATNIVVGVEDLEKRFPSSRPYWMAHPELHELPSVGSGGAAAINKMPDLEAVLAAHPEIIFISYMEKKNADLLQQKLGIPVVVLTYGALGTFDETVYESIKIAGRILDKFQRAEAVISYIKESKHDLAVRVCKIPEDKKPRVYAGCIGYRGTHGMESTQNDYTPFVWTAAKNVAHRKAPVNHMVAGKEEILEWDPDVIFIDVAGLDLFRQDYLKNKSFYNGLQAFRNRRVYALYPFNWYSTNIGTVICDSYATGKILYPAEFSDVDLTVKANDVYRFLLGRSVYNEMLKNYGPLSAVLQNFN